MKCMKTLIAGIACQPKNAHRWFEESGNDLTIRLTNGIQLLVTLA